MNNVNVQLFTALKDEKRISRVYVSM